MSVACEKVPEKTRQISGKHFRRRRLTGSALADIYFSDCTFSQLTLEHVQGKALYFENCRFSDVTLQAAELERCTFRQCQLTNIHIRDFCCLNLCWLACRWNRFRLQQGVAERWLLADCQLEATVWQHVTVHYWTAQDAVLSRCKIEGGRMQDANWHGCTLNQVSWHAAMLIRQVMGSCRLDQCRYLQMRCETLVWSACQLRQVQLRQLNLENASFQHSHLQACHLQRCNLSAALFTGASLTRCDLSRAQLPCAQLTDAVLTNCQLTAAQLLRACLRRARLTACDLRRADFTQADLRAADVTTSPLGAALTDKARLHGAQLHALDQHLQVADPLMDHIESWYSQHRPGAKNAPLSALPSTGACHYV